MAKSVLGSAVTIQPNNSGTATVSPPSGFFAISGGHLVQGSNEDFYVVESSPATGGGWGVTVYNAGSAQIDVKAFAVCQEATRQD